VTTDRKHSALSVLLAVALAVGLLWRPVLSMADGLWGPQDPWANGDFIGAYWLFWSAATSGSELGMLAWPYGEAPLMSSFPNPFDAWLLGPLLAHAPFPLGWNLMMLGHHLANVGATVVLARAAGCKTLPAAAAGALVAASPVMLYETMLGHTLTGAVWPGLLGLALLLRGRGLLAGLLIGVQGLCYLYTGLGFGLAALILRPDKRLLSALAVIGPYLLWLVPLLPAAESVPPPDGHTSLPLDGLLWASAQQQFRVHPVLLLGLAAPGLLPANERGRGWRWVGVAALALFLASGPTIAWSRGAEGVTSPLAWIQHLVPGMGRMHHPVRSAMLLVPALAVALALGLSRWPRVAGAALLLAALPTWRTIDNTCSWPEDPVPPGAEAAANLAGHEGAVLDLGSRSMEALALQPIHGRPILSGLHPRTHPRPGIDPGLALRVEAWAAGEAQPGLPAALRQQGFTHVLVVDRGPGETVDPVAVQAALGPPVWPGVYAL
jgi:hypothetical protein